MDLWSTEYCDDHGTHEPLKTSCALTGLGLMGVGCGGGGMATGVPPLQHTMLRATMSPSSPWSRAP